LGGVFAPESAAHGGKQFLQCAHGRAIGQPVDQTGAEMPLEGLDDNLCLMVENARYLDAIAIERQHRLQRLDIGTVVAGLQRGSAPDGCRRYEMADTGLEQGGPQLQPASPSWPC